MRKFDLTLSLQEAGERIVGGLSYATALFERGDDRALGGVSAAACCEAMVADDAAGGGAAAAAERGASGSSCWWSGTRRQAEYPQEQCIHELFEEQVARTPEAVAVVYEERAAELCAS